MSGYAARERELARQLEVPATVLARVDRLDLDSGVGLASLGRGHVERLVPRQVMRPRSRL